MAQAKKPGEEATEEERAQWSHVTYAGTGVW
jgi:hypothetical protein